MKIQSLKLVCFSPTGTTRAVIKGIARGINKSHEELIDITMPEARKQAIQTSENELLVVAVPVYMGRVPAIATEWLETIKAYNTPVVGVVVYGNRAYEDALLELKDILIKSGCIPIACAAFVGEHSFSCSETPTAEGRPDSADLNNAELFGCKISEMLESISSLDSIADLNIPGNFPYGGITKVWDVDFISVNNNCTQCRVCADGCPASAINPENCNSINIEKCITCCACIKNCPENARGMKPSPVKDRRILLNNLFKERKEPVFFR